MPVEEPLGTSKCLVPWQLSHVFSVETAWWTRAGSVDTCVFTSFSLAEHPYELSEAFLTPRTPLAKTHKTRGDEAQALADGSDLWAGAEELRGLGRGWGPLALLRVRAASLMALAEQSLNTVLAFLRKRENSLLNFLVSKNRY